MTTIVHSKVSGIADGGDASKVQPSDWNDDHVVVLSGNLITNGRFRTNQRGYASAASLASGEYAFDRWKATTASTTLTFTAAPQGQAVTINSGGSIAQIIEREELPAGDYVLSWAGTATGRIYNVGGSPPSYAASPVLVTLDGSANVTVEFQASGATKTLDLVQLESGSTPSSYNQPNVAVELWECMRHYQLLAGWTGMGDSTVAMAVAHNFAPKMRAAPTASKVSGASFSYRNNGGDSNVAAATWGIANTLTSTTGMWTQITGLSSITVSRPYHARFSPNSGPILAFSAEL